MTTPDWDDEQEEDDPLVTQANNIVRAMLDEERW